jgi:hypothetical protein
MILDVITDLLGDTCLGSQRLPGPAQVAVGDDRPAAGASVAFFGSFGHLHEAFLDELIGSRHGVCVDLDIGKEIRIPPVVNFRCGAAQLDFHTALDQVGDQILIRIAGRDATVGIVRAVMQRDVTGVRVKDRNDLRLGVPTGDVVLDELHVEDRGRQVPFELQGADTEHRLYLRQFHGNINVKRFL